MKGLTIPDTLKHLLSRQLLILIVVLQSGCLLRAQAIVESDATQPCLNASKILRFAGTFGKANGRRDSYPSFIRLAFGDAPRNLTAYEENPTFIYAAGAVLSPDAATQVRDHPQTSRVALRLILLKPSIMVIDAETVVPGSPAANFSCIESQTAPQITGGSFRVVEGNGKLTGGVLLPQMPGLRIKRVSPAGPMPGTYHLVWGVREHKPGTRFLCVVNSSGSNSRGGLMRARVKVRNHVVQLTIWLGGKSFHLSLPSLHSSAGSIEVANSDGGSLLDARPFPSSVLPHTPEGRRLLEAWDRDYRGNKPPSWDIGQPASELQRMVETGTIRACRAADLCCGSGSDAIYLARHGFKVTAIDIAPAALSQAMRKAQAAGVSVNWLLGDVLALPSLKPFDFIYDRGCYHVVRNQNLNAYIDTLRRLSHPGTQFLLLAARRDEELGLRQPSPGVTKDEMRFDFLPLFQIEKLLEIRLQSNVPGPGPLGWEVLMRRRVEP